MSNRHAAHALLPFPSARVDRAHGGTEWCAWQLRRALWEDVPAHPCAVLLAHLSPRMGAQPAQVPHHHPAVWHGRFQARVSCHGRAAATRQGRPGTTRIARRGRIGTIIALNQLNFALGLNPADIPGWERHEHFYERVYESLRHAGHTKAWNPVVFFVNMIPLLYLVKFAPARVRRATPGPRGRGARPRDHHQTDGPRRWYPQVLTTRTIRYPRV